MTVENLILPKARIVSGNPAEWKQAKDYHTQALKLDKNGAPLMQNWCHIAIPKAEFLAKVWPVMVQEAAKVYPNAVNVHPDNYLSERFAWKVVNGDSPMCPQGSAVPYNKREGYPGHYIVKLSTYAFPPSVVVFQNGAYTRLAENQIKTGDYIVTSVKLEGHADKDGGLYWNPNTYELVELGTALSNGEGGNPVTLLGDASTRTHAGFQGVLPPVGAAAHPASAPAMPQQMGAGTTLPPPVGMPQTPMGAPAMPQMPQQLGVPQYPQPLPAAGHVVPQMPPMQAGMMPPVAGVVGAAPTYPSNLPPPAHDFVQNMGNGVAPAMPQFQGGAPTAQPATMYPSNGVPGLPPAR